MSSSTPFYYNITYKDIVFYLIFLLGNDCYDLHLLKFYSHKLRPDINNLCTKYFWTC